VGLSQGQSYTLTRIPDFVLIFSCTLRLHYLGSRIQMSVPDPGFAGRYTIGPLGAIRAHCGGGAS